VVAPLLVAAACGSRQETGGSEPADTTAAQPAEAGGPAADGAGAGAGAAGGETAAAAGASDTGAAGAARPAAAGASDTAAAGAAAAREAPGGAATAAEGGVDWMRVDEGAKRVEFDVVAGLTPVNGNWNFNGYANGDLTITVPVGWTVVMDFTNHDGNVPHSVYVAAEEPPFPQVMPEAPGIPRAYSINLMNGLAAGRHDTLRFPVNTAGRYTMPCGVPGHAASGMWDWFVVSADAARPAVSTKS
jgi:hypothetical protein